MLNFNSSLQEFFDINEGTFDARNLVSSLVVYANQYYNYLKSDNCEAELKKEMEAKAKKYSLKFIADHKKKVIEDLKPYANCSKDGYYDSCIERVKAFKESCKEICYENWDDFFLVLDWIRDNFDWEDGEHYFEKFINFANNEPTMVHGAYFTKYAQELGEEDLLTLSRDNEDNRILNFIDWEGWANELKNDYSELTNPLQPSKVMYYRAY